MQRTEVRHLSCPLTDPEMIVKAQLVARANVELGDLENKKASFTKTLAEHIKEKRGELNKLSWEIEARAETRPVECRRVIVMAEQTVITIRCDTGEKVDERKMTETEIAAAKQAQLRFDDGDQADDSAH